MSVERPRILRWKQAAVDDLAAIVDRIDSDSPTASRRFREEITQQIQTLTAFPFSGGVAAEYPRARQLIFGNYIVYYTVSSREVVIRAIVHGARSFRPSWLRRK